MLEQQLHESSFFSTLTYSDEHYPVDGSVAVSELQLFMKRLRREVEPERIRFFGVGEYGDRTLRAHYHVALFGLSDPAAVEAAWTKGFAHVGFLTPESAAYLCGYTVKKLTKRDDARLEGRRPEFARMSLRPGIGAGAAGEIADAHRRFGYGDCEVPSVVRREKRMWPLGRYLRRRVRVSLGMDAGEHPVLAAERARQLQAELQAPGARAAREEQRKAVASRARVLDSISRSKKGVGL